MNDCDIVFCRYLHKGRLMKTSRRADLMLRLLVSLYIPSRFICGVDFDTVEIYRWSDLPGISRHEKIHRILEYRNSSESISWTPGETIYLPAFPEALEQAWQENKIPLSDLIEPLDYAICAANFELEDAIEMSEEELLVRLFNQITVPSKPTKGATLTRDEARLLLLLMYENSFREANQLIFTSLLRDLDQGEPRSFIRNTMELGASISRLESLNTAGFYFCLTPGNDSLPWHPEDDYEPGDEDLPF